MPSDSSVGNSETPGERPIPRGPWSVEDHHGAPRSARPRRVAWWVLYGLPSGMLAVVAVWSLLNGGNVVTAMAQLFAGATCFLTVVSARTLYRRGYYQGALQSSLDRVLGTDLDHVIARPEPHPADPSPLPHYTPVDDA